MKRLFPTFISLLLLGIFLFLFSRCREDNDEILPEKEAFVWDENLWQTLLKDSLVIELNEWLSYSSLHQKITEVWDSVPEESQREQIDSIWALHLNEIQLLSMRIKTKYPGYGIEYARRLNERINTPLSTRTPYEILLEEQRVQGDCGYAQDVYRELVSNFHYVYRIYSYEYPLSYERFCEDLYRGKVIKDMQQSPAILPSNILEGFRILGYYARSSNVSCNYVLGLAAELKRVNTYLTELNYILSQAIMAESLYNSFYLINSYTPPKYNPPVNNNQDKQPEKKEITLDLSQLPPEVKNLVGKVWNMLLKKGLMKEGIGISFEVLYGCETVSGSISEIQVLSNNKNLSGKEIEYTLDRSIKIILPPYNSTTHYFYPLIVMHEFSHLYLYSLSGSAGESGLPTVNKDLYDAIIKYPQGDPHHEYWAKHIDVYESWLREIFPGKSDDYYKYGKWGAFMNTEAFLELNPKERKRIWDKVHEIHGGKK